MSSRIKCACVCMHAVEKIFILGRVVEWDLIGWVGLIRPNLKDDGVTNSVLSQSMVPPAEMPAALVQPCPPRPSLTLLTWGEGNSITLPDAPQKNRDHPVFSAEFAKLVENAEKQFNLNGKRVEDGPPLKKPKIEVAPKTENEVPRCPVVTHPTELLHEVMIGIGKKLRLDIVHRVRAETFHTKHG